MDISNDVSRATSEGHVMVPPPPLDELPGEPEPPLPGPVAAAVTATVALTVGVEPPLPVHISP